MKIFDWAIDWINTVTHASFAKSSAKHCMKPTICNGDYTIDMGNEPRSPADVFKSPNKWNNGQVPSMDLDDMPLTGMPTGKSQAEIYVGDVIGNAGTEGGCQIEITGFRDDGNIVATVIKCGKFWTDLNKYKGCRGFVLGEELVLKHMGGGTKRPHWWNIVEPGNSPWFTLEVHSGGKKTFEHYR
jgi:hypothetical protein